MNPPSELGPNHAEEPSHNETAKTHVFLNPDGTQLIGMHVLVKSPTGIVYSTQAGGFMNAELAAEGYLIPVGSGKSERALCEFFAVEFGGHGYPSEMVWTEDLISRLEGLISEIACWSQTEGEDTRHQLSLDRSRLAQCHEAWIPVATPLQSGFLLFENSD